MKPFIKSGILTTVLISTCFAALKVTASPIPPERVSDYIEAVRVSLQKNPLYCDNHWAIPAEYSLEKMKSVSATTGELSENGGQPLLIFSSVGAGLEPGSSNALTQSKAFVVTSSNFVTVTALKIVDINCTKVHQAVNTGTLADPKISYQDVDVCNQTTISECNQNSDTGK